MPTYSHTDPDSVISNASAAKYPGGSILDADIWNAVNDAGSVDTSDYVSVISDDEFTLVVGTSNPTLPSNKRCVGVRVVTFIGGLPTGIDVTCQGWIKDGAGAGGEQMSINSYLNPGGGTWMIGSWIPSRPDGTEWTSAALNGLQIKQYMASVANVPVAYSMRADLWMATRPVTTAVPNPFPSGISAKDPLFNISQSSDGDWPYRMRVKVFTKAVAEGGGFNPDTSTHVYDSGLISYAATHQVPAGTLSYNTQYYVYAQSSTFQPAPVTEYLGLWSGQLFETTSQPTVNVTAPSVSNARPPIAWTYSDTDGKAQDKIEIRIYERPGASWTGFDPDTTTETPVWSVVDVPAVSPITPTVSLNNTKSHRAYARVKTATPFVVQSVWNFEEWTTAYTAPDAPIVVAVADNTNARHEIAVSNQENDASAVITIERTLDSGGSWQIVRDYRSNAASQNGQGLHRIDIGFDTSTTFYDYETPFNSPVQYRAYVETDNLGIYVKSANTTATAATLTIDLVWITICLGGFQRHFITQDVWLNKTKRKQRGIYEPLGRSKPIVFKGAADQEQWSMQFLALSHVDQAFMQAILDDEGVLLVRTPRRMFYAEVSQDMAISTALWDDLHNRPRTAKLVVNFVEVDRPAI